MRNDNKENLINEKFTDVILSYAGACHIDNIIDETENDYANDIINPNQKELDQAVGGLIKAYVRKQNLRRLLKSTKRVSMIAAIILVSIIIISTILVSSVDALRVMFFNVFIETKEDYSKITPDSNFNRDVDNLKNDEALKDCYIPGFIPKGFTLDNIMNQVGKVVMIFKDSDSSSLVFEQTSDIKREYMVDTENAQTEKLLIQGHEATMFKKDGTITVLWDNSDQMFNVFGQVSREDIIKFCENIYLKK